MDIYADARSRSIIKALSWRIFATVATVLIIYALTRRVVLSLGVGVIEIVVKLLLYYFHERIWATIPLGQKKNPLFDVIFQLDNLDSLDIPEVETAELSFTAYRQESDSSRFDLRWRAFEVEKSLIFRAEYCIELFKKETINRFINYFKEIVSTVIKNIDIKLEDIKLSHELYDGKSGFDMEDYSDFKF